MPVIQGGRWQRLLQKFFGIKGEIVAAELAPEIYTVAPVYPLPTELLILEGSRACVAEVTQAGVANQNTVILLRNPAKSNVIAVIKRWVAIEYNTFDNELSVITNTGLVGGASGFQRDTRGAQVSGGLPVATSVCQIQGANNVVGGNIAFKVLVDRVISAVAANASIYDVVLGRNGGDELILNPGDDWAVETSAPAGGINLRSTIWWTERPIEPSETPA